MQHLKANDNQEILELLGERLKLGFERYSHGVIVNSDTKKYGTKENDWELMAMAEVLDGLVYAAAAIIRYKRKNNN